MSKSVPKAVLDNRANQLNAQHPVYYSGRGLDAEQAMRQARLQTSAVPVQPVSSLPVRAKRSAKSSFE